MRHYALPAALLGVLLTGCATQRGADIPAVVESEAARGQAAAAARSGDSPDQALGEGEKAAAGEALTPQGGDNRTVGPDSQGK